MSGSLVRYLAVVGLLVLAGGVAVVTLTRPAPTPIAVESTGAVSSPAGPTTTAALDFVFIQDVDGWLRTPDEAAVTTPYDLRVGPGIESLPMNLGPWTGSVPDADRDFVLEYLKPDYWVYRRYERSERGKETGPADVIWLSLVASRDARSFHPPEVCYQAQGWAVGGRKLEPVPIGRGRIQAQRVVAAKDGAIHGVLYWYLWMNPQREVAEGCVMVKITTLIAPDEDWDVAFGRSKDFAAALFTDVLPWHRY
jgi:hypothetical protein